jgi:hypothetical protein
MTSFIYFGEQSTKAKCSTSGLEKALWCNWPPFLILPTAREDGFHHEPQFYEGPSRKTKKMMIITSEEQHIYLVATKTQYHGLITDVQIS